MSNETKQTLLDSIANYVRTARKQKGWTAADLGHLLSEVGVKWDRFAVAKLENGKRQNLTITEVVALARVLDIPPVLLLFPLGHAEQVEVLPGQTVGTWAGLKWFTGEAAFPTDTLDGVGEHPGAAGIGDLVDEEPVSTTLHLFQRHRDLVREHAKAKINQRESDVKLVEARIASIRQQMRRHGLTPSSLSEELRNVDQAAE